MDDRHNNVSFTSSITYMDYNIKTVICSGLLNVNIACRYEKIVHAWITVRQRRLLTLKDCVPAREMVIIYLHKRYHGQSCETRRSFEFRQPAETKSIFCHLSLVLVHSGFGSNSVKIERLCLSQDFIRVGRRAESGCWGLNGFTACAVIGSLGCNVDKDETLPQW